MKTVEYKDIEYAVPDWANYICADGDGEVWCYEYEPEWVGKTKKYKQDGGPATQVYPVAERPELKRI